MKRIFIIGILMMIIAISGCTVREAQTPEQPKPQPVSGEHLGTKNIEISGYSFNPATLTIPKGTTVVWTNKDSVIHTATSDDGLFDSGSLSKEGSWSYTFNDVGTYRYHCTPHPYMKGTIIVE